MIGKNRGYKCEEAGVGRSNFSIIASRYLLFKLIEKVISLAVIKKDEEDEYNET